MRRLASIIGLGAALALLVPDLAPAQPAGEGQKREGRVRRGGQGAEGGPRMRKGPGGAKAKAGRAQKASDTEGRPLGPDGKKPRGNRAMVGNSFLRSGSARAAVMSFRKQLEADPGSAALHVGLGRALARIGKCDEALAELWPYVGTSPFGTEAAFAASNCSSRLGLVQDAVFFDHIAVSFDPANARALTSLALDLDAAGDAAGLEQVLDDLSVANPGKDASFYVRSVIALRNGELDEFDTLTALWERDAPGSRDLRLLRGVSWLDVDDPLAAYETIQPLRSIRGNKQVRLTRAEALRRLGTPDEAASFLEDRPQSVLEGVDADAIRARVLVDEGKVAEARALLEGYEGLEDPDYLASDWYVARAAGDKVRMERAASRYEDVNRSPLRLTSLLVPITRR